MTDSPRQFPSKWISRLLLLVGLVAIVGTAGGIMLAASSQDDSGPKLTHQVGRSNLTVTVVEQGTLESSQNTEIKCGVRGWSVVTWIVDGGTTVEPGDELVRLDTKRIEDEISRHTTESHTARATLERTKADFAKAQMAEEAYLEGQYKTERQRLARSLKIAQTNLETAQKMLEHARSMFQRGYVSDLEVQGNEFTVKRAKLELEVVQTEINVLEQYTKQMELETIRGNLLASEAKLKADNHGLSMDEGRRDRATQELDQCVIKATRSGMVIYPSAAAWKNTPDVTEGANVRKDQVLLLMPDLEQMQVKVGIHESMIDRLKVGMKARITLTEGVVQGEVKSVASVAQPAGWWTGNMVKYDTIISIPSLPGLKPGMSAEVEVILAELQDVISIPVAAVVETEEENLCWVKTPNGFERRPLLLGDSNDVFIEVKSGISENDEVVLNPRAFIDEAKEEVLKITAAEVPDAAPTKGQTDAAKSDEAKSDAAKSDQAGAKASRASS